MHSTNTHVDDGQLIQYLDEECTPAEAEGIQRHLAECIACASQVADLREVSRAFGRAVFEANAEVRPQRPWWARRGARIAATILFAIGVTVAVPQARAWLADRWEDARTIFAPDDAPPVTPSVAPQDPTRSRVSFRPAGDEFVLEIEMMQADGSLSITLDTARRVDAEVLGGDGTDELIVQQRGLRIANAAQSTASYRLRIPRHFRQFEVWVAGRLVLRHTSGQGPDSWRFDLTNPQPVP